MTYLLSQIFISLVLAALAGGAIGWILNGFRARRREAELSAVIARHASALGQAQQERQMIADDYDEMKLGLESRIGELQVETRRMPELRDNLEKSQQLIQQMMKTHESELAEISNSNSSLQNELDGLKHQQQNDRSEISALRKTNGELGGYNSKSGVVAPTGDTSNDGSRVSSESAIEPATKVASAADTLEPVKTSNTVSAAADTADAGSSAELITEPTKGNSVATPLTTGPASAQRELHQQSSFDDATVTQDELLELESEIEEMRGYDRAFSNNTPADSAIKPAPGPSTGAAVGTAAGAAAAAITATSSSSVSTESNKTGAGPQVGTREQSSMQPAEKKGELGVSDKNSADDAAMTRLRDKFTTASTSDNSDDLQTIHGIGPVIEQSLNDLGINSYQQIAELTRREIEEIAEILEIFPGRIERDNWIGSARKLARETVEQPSAENAGDKNHTTNKGTEKSLQAEEV